MSDAQKESALKALGVSQVIFEPFTADFKQLTPQEFVNQVLIKRFKASHVFMGPNFRFGHKAQGTVKDLQADKRFETHVIDSVQVDGELCSSSLIRGAIQAGDLSKAEKLLGRPYVLTGKVVKGANRGKQLGFPTANLEVEQEVLPPLGVYATYVDNIGQGVTNIGRRPTFDKSDAIHVETYFPDWKGDLYGKHLELVLQYRIRGEKAFESIEALKEQIQKDVLQVTSKALS